MRRPNIHSKQAIGVKRDGSPPLIFADANVLYASALRDILIELALDATVNLRWSPMVLDELARALVRTRPDYTV